MGGWEREERSVLAEEGGRDGDDYVFFENWELAII